MINIEKFNRQHDTIMTEVNFIEREAKKSMPTINLTEIAIHIRRRMSYTS